MLHKKYYALLIIFSLGFSTHINAQFQLNGNAAKLSCTCYQLTANTSGQMGSAWYINPVDLNDTLNLTFDVFLGCADYGADGIVFVLQPVSINAGSGGQGMGYGGISPSIGIEIDTYENTSEGDIPQDHIALNSNGVATHNLISPIALPDVEDCNYHTLGVYWDPVSQTIKAFFDGNLMFTYNDDIVANIFNGNPNVFLGFTGATGMLYNEQIFCLDTTLPVSATASICSGDSILLEGNYQSGNGIYFDTLTSIGGCDSVIATLLTVVSTVTGSDQVAICAGDSIMIAGAYQSQEGTYYDTLASSNGCDSIIANTLMVFSTDESLQQATICDGDSLFIEGAWQFYSGIYFDTLSNVNGCDSVISTTLIASSPSFSMQQKQICAGDSIFINGNWQKLPGVFLDTLASVNGCDSIIQTTLDVNTLPVADAGLDTTILAGSSIQLIATGGITYAWSPAEGLGCYSCESTIATPGYSITYILSVTDINGCSDTDKITVTVEELKCTENDIFIANIFSPNNDGLNDVLRVRMKKECVEWVQFFIYNRWGQRVFESEDIEKGWDGKFRGNELSSGVFVYFARVKLVNSEKVVEIKDNLTIIK